MILPRELRAIEYVMSLPGVQSAVLTCESSPVQIEGKLKDGRFFYLRNRSGYTRVGTGDCVDTAVEMSMMNNADCWQECNCRAQRLDRYEYCSNDLCMIDGLKLLLKDGWP